MTHQKFRLNRWLGQRLTRLYPTLPPHTAKQAERATAHTTQHRQAPRPQQHIHRRRSGPRPRRRPPSYAPIPWKETCSRTLLAARGIAAPLQARPPAQRRRGKHVNAPASIPIDPPPPFETLLETLAASATYPARQSLKDAGRRSPARCAAESLRQAETQEHDGTTKTSTNAPSAPPRQDNKFSRTLH